MKKYRPSAYILSSLMVACLFSIGSVAQVMASSVGVSGGGSGKTSPSVILKESTKTVQTGYNFKVELYENSGSYFIKQVKTQINFPESDMQYIGSSGSAAFPGLSIGPSQGSIVLDSSTNGAQRGTFLVATLQFKALVATNTSINTTTATQLVDRANQHFMPKVTTLPIDISKSLATKLQERITSGNSQIALRVKDLNVVEAKMTGVVTLSKNAKDTLIAQIASEISGLNALKSKIDSGTTLSSVDAGIKTIYSDYRVYVLILPKIALIETADKELVTSAQFSQLNKLLAPLVAAAAKSNSNGAKVAQVALKNMDKEYRQARAISATIEVNVLPLQPSDYNSNPGILKGDNAQLVTANKDNNLAAKDAVAVLVALSL